MSREEVPRPAAASPWRLLLHGGRAAFDPRKVLLAAAGLLLLQAGWDALGWAFGTPDATTDVIRSALEDPPPIPRDAPAAWEYARGTLWRLSEPARLLVAPLRTLFGPGEGLGGRLHGLLAVAWAAAVWGLVGGTIARIRLLELAGGGLTSPAQLGPLRFAARFAGPLILTPLHPLFLAVLLGLGAAGFGLVARIPFGIGAAVGGVLFVVPLLLNLGTALLLAALVAGWPLMHAAVAAECEDSLDALSRSLSYLNRRPGTAACEIARIGVIGLAGLFGADLLFRAVLGLTSWGTGFAAPGFWARLARLLAHAWIYAYAWTQAASLYAILRWEADRTPPTAVASGTAADPLPRVL